MSKIVKATEGEFTFHFSGSEVYQVTAEGIIVDEIVARTMEERFAVSVSEGPESEVIAPEPEIAPEVAPEVAPEPETVTPPADAPQDQQ